MSIKIALIGATGSVGGAVLDICARFPDRFQIVAVASHSNVEVLFPIAKRFGARYAYLSAPTAETVRSFEREHIGVFSGSSGLESLATLPEVDHVVFASSGTEAIKALQKALSADKDVSLANKESIVVAGPWVMPLVRRPDQLRPIDSEHNAIWQCLREEPPRSVRKIVLTASGGPFRTWSREEMSRATPADALKHPVWSMGAKITIDSATLMNKGIECIEAMQLFGVPASSVGALIHPRSQVHGFVRFSDSTVKFLFSRPDMRLPVASALAWPERLVLEDDEELAVPPLSEWSLEFFKPDVERFPCLSLALEAGRRGGAYPPLLIGADFCAVVAFLERRIPFTDISNIIERTMESYSGGAPSSLEEAIELIRTGERIAQEVCDHGG